MAKKKTVKKKTAKKTVKKKTVKKKAKSAAKRSVITPPALPKAKVSAVVGDVETLMEMMVNHDVTEIDIEDGPRKIVLRRGSFSAPQASVPVHHFTPAPPASTPPASVHSDEAPQPEDTSDLIDITSPMVGTFYAAASPEDAPFTSNGANVTDNTVVCIIEAMKVMNEIKAECAGAIAEICVKNADPVEFGQVIFRVKPL